MRTTCLRLDITWRRSRTRGSKRVWINRSILLLGLLLIMALPGAAQTSRPTPSEAAVRPVKKLPSQLPSVADIDFAEFEIQRLYLGQHGPSPWRIPRQPSKASHYYVQPRRYGEEAIATAKFEAIVCSSSICPQKYFYEKHSPAKAQRRKALSRLRGLLC